MTEFPNTKSSLIAQVKSSENREAWDEFVLIYRPVIYRMARRRGMQDADAQDLVQTVLVRVAGAIDRWEKRGPEIRFRHWLRRVARNAMASAFSRRRGERGSGGSQIADLLAEHPYDEGLQAEYEKEAMREMYLRAAATVKTDVDSITWHAFELSVLEEKSCEEVAELLGRNIGTVYAARSRIMRRLRDEIQRLQELQK